MQSFEISLESLWSLFVYLYTYLLILPETVNNTCVSQWNNIFGLSIVDSWSCLIHINTKEKIQLMQSFSFAPLKRLWSLSSSLAWDVFRRVMLRLRSSLLSVTRDTSTRLSFSSAKNLSFSCCSSMHSWAFTPISSTSCTWTSCKQT